MYNCPNCNFNTESAMNFCPQCGNKMVNVEPVEATYVEPAQPIYANSVTYSPVPAKKPSLAKLIVGMALSIEGFALAIFTALYSLMGLVDPALGFGMAFAFSLFGLPGSIIGFVFSNSARNAGDVSTFSRVGKNLGLAGIIITGTVLFLSFIAMFDAL